MNKSYWIVPLIGILIFAAVNSQFREAYNERERQAKVAAQQVREAELEAQRVARELAMQEALAAQERRRIEREERDAQKQRELDERRELIAKRDEAFREQEKFAREAKALRVQIDEVKESIADAERKHAALLVEVEANRKLADKAEANVVEMTALLDQVAADQAALAAAKLAAAKKK